MCTGKGSVYTISAITDWTEKYATNLTIGEVQQTVISRDRVKRVQ